MALNLLVERYPDKKWDFRVIDMDWEFIRTHPNEDYDYRALSGRKDIPWDFVEKNIHKDWCMFSLSRKEDLPASLVRKYPDRGWYWTQIADPTLIDDFPTKSWDYDKISKMVDQDFILKRPNVLWYECSGYYQNKNLSVEWILSQPCVDFPKLSNHRDLNISHVLPRRKKSWSWSSLSRKLPISDILTHPELPWCFYFLSMRNDFSWNLIDTSLDWDFSTMCEFIHIPLQFILNNNKKWNWHFISGRNKVTWLVVYCYPDKPWDYSLLSRRFKDVSTDDTLNKIKKLQRWWKDLYYKPGRPYSKRILENIKATLKPQS